MSGNTEEITENTNDEYIICFNSFDNNKVVYTHCNSAICVNCIKKYLK